MDIAAGKLSCGRFHAGRQVGIIGADDGIADRVGRRRGPAAQAARRTYHADCRRGDLDDGKQAISAAGGPEYRMVGKERFLMASRPTDFTVRIVGRWHRERNLSLARVAQSTGDLRDVFRRRQTSAVVAGDVQVIDVDAKQLVTTICVHAAGHRQPPRSTRRPTPPNEPFRLAIFSHDGKRVITGTQSSGVHVWELPTKPEPKPLDGVANPPDLASFKPPAWSADSAAAAHAIGRARRQRDGWRGWRSPPKRPKRPRPRRDRQETSRSARQTAAHRRKPAQDGQGVPGKQLYLEAEECLRAALMADPTNQRSEEALRRAETCGPSGAGPVSITAAWVKEMNDLEMPACVPIRQRTRFWSSIPIEVAVVEKGTKLTQVR